MTEQTSASRPNQDKPVRQRWGWGKKIGVTVLVLLLVLVVFRLVWGTMASSRLAQMVAESRQVHPFMSWQDVLDAQPEQTSPAVDLYNQAGDLLAAIDDDTDAAERTQDGTVFGLYVLTEDILGPNRHAAQRKTYLQKCTPARELIDQAQQHTTVSAGLWSDVAWEFGEIVHYTTNVRDYLELAGLDAASRNDVDSALQCAEQLNHLARLVQQAPALIPLLQAGSCLDKAATIIERTAPGSRIGDERGQVSAERIGELMHSPCSDEAFAEALAAAVAFDRTLCYCLATGATASDPDGMNQLVDTMYLRMMITALRPFWDRDLADFLHINNACIRAVESNDNFQGAMEYFKANAGPAGKILFDYDELSLLDKYTKPVTTILLSSFGGTMRVLYQTRARERLASLRLAMLLWENQHPDTPLPDLQTLADTYDLSIDDPLTGKTLQLLTEGDESVLASAKYESIAEVREAILDVSWETPAAIWLDPKQKPATPLDD